MPEEEWTLTATDAIWRERIAAQQVPLAKARIIFLYVDALIAGGRLAEAEPLLDHLIDEYRNFRLFRKRSHLEHKRGRLADALFALEEERSLLPFDAHAERAANYHWQAVCLFETNRDRARESVWLALKHSGLGTGLTDASCFELLGDLERETDAHAAAAHYTKALLILRAADEWDHVASIEAKLRTLAT